MDNFLETLKQVEAFTAENTVSVYCPISQLTLDFKPLTVTQTKEMIKSKIDTNPDIVEAGTRIANVYNKIAIENCIEGPDTAKNLTIIDREIILFELRRSNDPVYIHDGTEINLSTISKNFSNVKPDKKLISSQKKLKFKAGDVTLKLSIPSIEKDKRFNDGLIKLCKDKKLNDILAELLITEGCKYINSLTVGETDINVDDNTDPQEFVNLIQRLPTSVLNTVSEYITTVKTYRNTLFSIENKLIELDSDFFSSI